MTATRYVMLMCSLPHHGPLFGAVRPPLSRIRLNEYLQQLDTEDRADYDTVSLLLDWSSQTRVRDDARIAQDARRLIPTLRNPLVRAVVRWRLELRSAVAALRRRQRGESTPPAGRDWGYGRWLPTMARHWSEPELGLGKVYPWIGEARSLLTAGSAVQLERLLLGVVWQDLERRSEGHEFDFEAVLLYCMRWEIVARWTHYHADAAKVRFEHLAREALAGVDLDAVAA